MTDANLRVSHKHGAGFDHQVPGFNVAEVPAAGGEAGAARALEIYREEIDRVMGLTGVRTHAELGPQHIQFAGSPPRDSLDHGAEGSAEPSHRA